jgi:tRNA-2-methylthio-N6-dimethylallyladenosine synthase
MNVADSELVESLLQKEGYTKASQLDKADAIFVNTCAIREHAEEKVHSQLGRYDLIKKEKPETIIGVLGCMAQSLKHDLLENRPFVDIILGPDSYRRLPELLHRKTEDSNSLVDTTLSRFEVYDDLFPSRNEGVNAWISIMRGCDKFCTFCIVPFTRGRERSRSVDSIIAEATQAVQDGFSEITLLGQNVNSYSHDQMDFHHLLDDVAQVPGLKRIRYTSPHPQDMTDELLKTMAKHDTICNYVHLPLQAGK